MQHQGLTEPQAHKALLEMAMNQNKKLSEIADAMLAVSALLGKNGHKPKPITAPSVCNYAVQDVQFRCTRKGVKATE